MFFGTAGVPKAGKSTFDGVRTIRELGLELHGGSVCQRSQNAREVGKLAKSLGVTLSVHAPFTYADNEVKVKQILQRILDSTRIG